MAQRQAIDPDIESPTGPPIPSNDLESLPRELETPRSKLVYLALWTCGESTVDDLDPVVEYHEEIAEHGADIRRNIEGDVTSGEISTVVEYDYSGLNMKYNTDEIDEDQLDVAILTGPDGEPGAMNVPYGYALLEDAPNPDACKLFMDYVLSLEGQEKFFDAFVRPIRADELDQPEEFLDQSAYDATEFALDQEELVEKQAEIQDELTDRTPLPGAQ